MNEINFGLVGARNVGKGHVRRCAKLEKARFTAVADSERERAQKAADEFGIQRVFTDAESLFELKDIDAVVLAVPNPLHAELSIKAMQAGKHVLVEKPIARTSEEAEAMIRTSRETGQTLMVGMNQRFEPGIYALKNSIRQNTLGTPQYAQTAWNLRRPFEGLWGRGDWFLSEQAGGGPLIDLGVHRLDLVMHLLDFPEPEVAFGMCFSGVGRAVGAERGRDYQLEDFCTGIIRMAGGIGVHLEAAYFLNRSANQPPPLFIHGTKGGVEMDDGPVIVTENGEQVKPEPLPDAQVSHSAIEHFSRVLHGEEELSATPEQAKCVLRIVEALYESARTGHEVALS